MLKRLIIVYSAICTTHIMGASTQEIIQSIGDIVRGQKLGELTLHKLGPKYSPEQFATLTIACRNINATGIYYARGPVASLYQTQDNNRNSQEEISKNITEILTGHSLSADQFNNAVAILTGQQSGTIRCIEKPNLSLNDRLMNLLFDRPLPRYIPQQRIVSVIVKPRR